MDLRFDQMFRKFSNSTAIFRYVGLRFESVVLSLIYYFTEVRLLRFPLRLGLELEMSRAVGIKLILFACPTCFVLRKHLGQHA